MGPLKVLNAPANTRGQTSHAGDTCLEVSVIGAGCTGRCPCWRQRAACARKDSAARLISRAIAWKMSACTPEHVAQIEIR